MWLGRASGRMTVNSKGSSPRSSGPPPQGTVVSRLPPNGVNSTLTLQLAPGVEERPHRSNRTQFGPHTGSPSPHPPVTIDRTSFSRVVMTVLDLLCRSPLPTTATLAIELNGKILTTEGMSPASKHSLPYGPMESHVVSALGPTFADSNVSTGLNFPEACATRGEMSASVTPLAMALLPTTSAREMAPRSTTDPPRRR